MPELCPICNKHYSCLHAPIRSIDSKHLKLCYYCYKGLSSFYFDIGHLKSAIKYLKEKETSEAN